MDTDPDDEKKEFFECPTPFSSPNSKNSTTMGTSSFRDNLDVQNSFDLDLRTGRSLTTIIPSFKRWNSMPMGINFNYSLRCPEPSPSSSSSDDEDGDISTDPDNSGIIPPSSIERKSASLCYDRRPASASGAGCLPRHRSSSSALFLPSMIPYRLLDRGVEKLKREANIRSCIETDYAGEKMSITGAAIMYCMDEFNIADNQQGDNSVNISEQRRRTQSLTEPVHVLTNLLPASCSPSPTRIEKQCYSPSMQQIVRSVAMSPSSSPSPTRRQCLRSLSPIALRSGMGLKRKHGDADTESNGAASAKRANYSVPTTPPVSIAVETSRTLFGLPTLSLIHSLSESSIDSETSNSTISSDFTNTPNIIHQHPIVPIPQPNAAPITSNATSSNDMEDFPAITEESISRNL